MSEIKSRHVSVSQEGNLMVKGREVDGDKIYRVMIICYGVIESEETIKFIGFEVIRERLK